MSKDPLARFGVAMERPLLAALDAIAEARGTTRSEILRDLVRGEVVRSQVARGTQAVAAVTLVYDHHVRDLSEHLTEIQHGLGEKVRASLHVHLDSERCLEVIVMRGRSGELKDVADRLLATRGVKHGGIELITDLGTDSHDHDHADRHDHSHGHSHASSHPGPKAKASKRAIAKPRKT